MIKHLYKRTITRKGKSIKAWYYWYYDESGKQVRKTCGSNGKPCLTKRDAEIFLESIKDKEINNEKITFNDFCKDFYADDSVWMLRKQSKGKKLSPKTMQFKRNWLNKFLSQFGNEFISKTDINHIETWILLLPHKSTRNCLISCVNDVYKELYNHKIVSQLLQLEWVKNVKQKNKGIITVDEIKYLYPEDEDIMIQRWKSNKDSELDAYKIAVMTYCILTTGMRSGEVRAITKSQFVEKNVILLNAMIDASESRVNHLKKGDDLNKKWRVIILPDRAVKMLDNLSLMEKNTKKTEYLFERFGEAMTSNYLNKKFRASLLKNKINPTERNISIHSLRYTYNTMMKKEIEGKDLRLMMGHVSEEMTEYYDRSQALDHLPQLKKNIDAINNMFN